WRDPPGLLEVALHHALRDGRRVGRAVQTVLHEHRDHDLGRLDRRERDEPGVVAVAHRDLALGQPLRALEAHHLRRAGLAADAHAGDARLAAGAARLAHDRLEAAQHGLDVRAGQLLVAAHLGRELLDALPVARLDAQRDARLHHLAAVRERAV